MSAESDARSPQPVDVVRFARARWWSAESQLYPLVMRDPDLYRAVLSLVGGVLTELRTTCERVEDLLDDGFDVVGIVQRKAQEYGTRLGGIDPRLVADAARALRDRELVPAGPPGESRHPSRTS